MKRVVAYSILILLFCNVKSWAQAGFLDSTYNGTGYTNSFPIGSGNSLSCCALQPDGKLVATGAGHIFGSNVGNVIVRYNTNGTVDTSFGINGAIPFTNYNPIPAIIVQPDGKIVVATGSLPGSPYCLTRFLSSGVIDSSFGVNGVSSSIALGNVTGSPRKILLQTNGKIVLMGDYNFAGFAVACFNNNGTIDSSFAFNGALLVDSFPTYSIYYHMYGCTLDTNGKILITGQVNYISSSIFCIIRLNANGTYDGSFGGNGQVVFFTKPHSVGNSVMVQSDGKIIIAGVYETPSGIDYLFTSRINNNGTLDTGYGTNGFFLNTFGYSGLSYFVSDDVDAIIQSDDKVVVSFNANAQFLLARINPSGTVDINYGINGHIYHQLGGYNFDVNDIAIQTDDKILLCGSGNVSTNNTALTVCRVNSGISTGIINFKGNTANEFNPFIYPNPIQNVETLEYTLVNDETISISLYNINGELVQTFFANQKRTEGTHKEKIFFNPLLVQGSYILEIGNAKSSFGIKLTK